MQPPTFKYHPDPVATGSVVESDAECVCCGQARGLIYDGPTYAVEEYESCICPWCIADGSAHEQLDASFTDEAGVGGCGQWDAVPEAVVSEVAHRTPGFSGWQQEQWWTHCGDAARFLGRAGRTELEGFGPAAIDAIRASTGLDDGPEWRRFFAALDKEGSPTAYVFQCSICGALGGYQDCH
jgi:uncharacterized protein CbrC (UPF0167 family)